MMDSNETSRCECAHCSGSGTCTVDDGVSCGTCIKDAKVKEHHKIVRCGVCKGIGTAEPTTQRFIARMPVFVVFTVLAVFYLYVVFYAGNEAHFNQIFPLIGSLTTMIVTFYFARK